MKGRVEVEGGRVVVWKFESSEVWSEGRGRMM